MTWPGCIAGRCPGSTCVISARDCGRTALEGGVESLRDHYLLVEGDLDPSAPALIGPDPSGRGVRALVHVDDAPDLPTHADLTPPSVSDLVTFHLREARRSSGRSLR